MDLWARQGSVSNLPQGVSRHYVQVGQIRTHYPRGGGRPRPHGIVDPQRRVRRPGRVQLALQHRAARPTLPRLRAGPGRLRAYRSGLQLQRSGGLPPQAYRRVHQNNVSRSGASHGQFLRRRFLSADGDGPALRGGLGDRGQRWRQGAGQRRTQGSHRLHRRPGADARDPACLLLPRAVVGRRRGGGALEGQPGTGGMGSLRGRPPGTLGTAQGVPSGTARLRQYPLPGADRGGGPRIRCGSRPTRTISRARYRAPR